MQQESIQKELIQRYSGRLAQETYNNIELDVMYKRVNEELLEFKQVLESDETLKVLFYEQKEKLNSQG